ncbi:hypothetical protein O3G_MSEX005198 [Manduca sexta]|uniref:Carboxylic ester hydrolase n=1 Tax=Manduca sexta TaxID=7130 RepID=A0A921YZW6_MANSE|nr:hypothetical protein O3G_MSEX005198 [Manduca sexta]
MISYACFIFLSLCLFHNVESSARIDPLVETKVGLIRGLRSGNGQYSMFMGIPFGQVNASNPFGAASEHPHFNDVFEAYSDTSVCPQIYQFNNSVAGHLDCLRLNIYVPSSATSKNRLPVMVWLYGGSFRRGFGGRVMFGPDFLVRHDVILVTVNYRVGPYGFMCLDIPEVPGNQGLKDQFMGMRWIKDNIEAFGGDVNKITLFGESAGAHSVELHVRSSKEKLYNKIIIQSGSAVAATVLIPPDREAPIKLADKLGFATNDVYEALAFLTSLDTNLVIAASIELGFLFKPCVEREFEGVDSFITSSWIEAPVPKIANVPVMIGFNEHELMYDYVNKNDANFNSLNIFSDYLDQAFDFNMETRTDLEKIVRHFYLGDAAMSKDVTWSLINFDSDFTYIHPVQRSINKFIESAAGDVFYYMFSYSGGRNFYKIYNNILEGGASHADELGYLFNMSYLTEEPTHEDQLIIDRMTTMWTNFAKFSKPTPEATNLIPVVWTPVTNKSYNYLRIDTELKVGSRPFNDRMAFWDLFYDMNRDAQKKFEPIEVRRMTQSQGTL